MQMIHSYWPNLHNVKMPQSCSKKSLNNFLYHIIYIILILYLLFQIFGIKEIYTYCYLRSLYCKYKYLINNIEWTSLGTTRAHIILSTSDSLKNLLLFLQYTYWMKRKPIENSWCTYYYLYSTIFIQPAHLPVNAWLGGKLSSKLLVDRTRCQISYLWKLKEADKSFA